MDPKIVDGRLLLGWPNSTGTAGRFRPEQVADFNRSSPRARDARAERLRGALLTASGGLRRVTEWPGNAYSITQAGRLHERPFSCPLVG